ncbi:MAG: DUF1499 domain-containing protein [Pseudolabrys sp.]|jgi:hypothetical protein|nr:DUF1499 domain-containing protein [Pseudolabrys sp.]
MARRPFPDEPVSRIAIWSSRLALFAIAVAAISVIIVRSGLLEIVPALATFAAALVFAGIAILFAFAAFVVIWRQGIGGLGRALLALFLGLALLAYPAYLGTRAWRLPAISDVTTDTTNPPRFDVLARLRPRGRTDYPGPAVAALQRTAYPDVIPLDLDVPTKIAYDAALALVTKRKWYIGDTRPPTLARRDGVIEAVARTPIMGFRDDVVIRITPVGQGTRVDMRSASRFGNHDLGANASRIRSLLGDIDEVISSAPEPRSLPEKKAPPTKKGQPEKRQPAKR